MKTIIFFAGLIFFYTNSYAGFYCPPGYISSKTNYIEGRLPLDIENHIKLEGELAYLEVSFENTDHISAPEDKIEKISLRRWVSADKNKTDLQDSIEKLNQLVYYKKDQPNYAFIELAYTITKNLQINPTDCSHIPSSEYFVGIYSINSSFIRNVSLKGAY